MDILKNVEECIATGWVSTGGKFIMEFEDKMAKYLKVDKAVSAQSGTAGLHLALSVLGVGDGDEVIVPTVTFIAAVNPVTYVGAKPIFMDCDDTLNMDLDKLEKFLAEECDFKYGVVVNKKTGNIVKAIVVVHVFGNPIDMERLMDIKERYNLDLVEDATEALGSYYTAGKYEGKYCGTVGDIGVYSFNANKIITTGGGGMIVSKYPELLEKMKFLSEQAKTDPMYFVHDEIGYNYRLTNIQAAFGTDQIDRLEGFISTKMENYKLYEKGLSEIDGLEILPFNENSRWNHWFYSVKVDKDQYGMDRDELLKKLNDIGIQSRPIWALTHRQKPYQNCQSYDIEKAYVYADNIINLPCGSNLSSEDVEFVLETLKSSR